MKTLITSLLSLVVWSSAIAQDVSVSGTITDSKGQPLAGVEVKVSETSAISYTNAEGKFTITVVDGYETLLFALDGYQIQKQFIGGKTTINLSMSSNVEEEQELSLGYGTQSKDKLTGSVSSIGEEAVGNAPIANLEQAGQGKTTGLQVQNSSGAVGEAPVVRIRGGSSLSNSNQPLYVVDGVPLSSGSQTNINSENIASMEVLKDASAAALYGSRAANGVVIIQTKTGRKNGFAVQASYQYGISSASNKLDMMSPEEYRVMLMENLTVIRNTNGEVTYRSRENLLSWLENETQNVSDLAGGTINIGGSGIYFDYHNTDWQKEVFRTGASNNFNLNLQGGTEDVSVMVTGNYLKQEGILVGNQFQRFNGSLAINAAVSKKLSLNLSSNYIFSINDKLRENLDQGYPLQALLIPGSDAYDPENDFVLLVEPQKYYNPLTEIAFSDNQRFTNSSISSLGLNYDITDRLSLNLSGGLEAADIADELRLSPKTQDGAGTGYTQLDETETRNYLLDGYLTFEPDVGSDHSLSLILGGSYQKNAFLFDSKNAPVDGIDILKRLSESNPDDSLTVLNGSEGNNVLISAFSRVGYSYKDKYLLQLSARMDQSSKFGANNPTGVFPAISGGWLLSNENALAGNPTINLLKLKASYGLIGNVPLDDFLFRTNYFKVNYAGSDFEALRIINYENPDLKWETTAQSTVGVDFQLFSRLSGSVEYYHKKTTDLLFPVPVSPTSGLSNVFRNLGTMTNKGIEINLNNINISKGNITWSTDFNLSFNKNKITDLDGLDLVVVNNTFREGAPAGSFFLREFAGVNPENGNSLYFLNRTPTSDEVTGADPDAFLLEEQYGERYVTDDWNIAERKILGNPNPKYFGGLTNTIRYKDIALSFLIQFVGDVDLYFETGEWIANSGYGFFNQLASQGDRWYQPGNESDTPALYKGTTTNASSRWLQDGSYARLKSLTLTYSLPGSILERMSLDFLEVYIGAQNLFTLTNYIGYDPDVNYVAPEGGIIGQNITRGVDNFNAPQPRIIMTGIKIGL